MSIAALVLGVVGTVLGAWSLLWLTWSALVPRRRVKLTPIVGFPTADGFFSGEAHRDVADVLRSAAVEASSDSVLIGVRVANRGRVPLHVTGWAVRADPSRVSFAVRDNQIDGPVLPCDVAPGTAATFYTDLARARTLAGSSDDSAPQRIRLVVSSGARTFASRSLHPAAVTVELP